MDRQMDDGTISLHQIVGDNNTFKTVIANEPDQFLVILEKKIHCSQIHFDWDIKVTFKIRSSK